MTDRRLALLNVHIDLLRAAFRQVRAPHPFAIEAAVILPDHLHAIWTLREQDADFALRCRLIKNALSHGLMRGERISTSRVGKGEREIWQRRYWEHTLRDQDDFRRHLDYIRFNPVKHGYAPRVQDWPYSSFRRWVRLGAYPRRVGWRSQYRGTRIWGTMMGFAALNPSYLLSLNRSFGSLYRYRYRKRCETDRVPGRLAG
jgi:putative transposase